MTDLNQETRVTAEITLTFSIKGEPTKDDIDKLVKAASESARWAMENRIGKDRANRTEWLVDKARDVWRVRRTELPDKTIGGK